MLGDALAYIKTFVIQEKIIKHPEQAEAARCFNYAFAAIEEALCNAIYHRSYEIREPVEMRILPDKISVTSFPGPDRSIRRKDMMKYRFIARRYRNRRIGNFLKELNLTEGRGTGFPKMLNALNANASPLPDIHTDDNRTWFVIEFPIHPAFLSPQKDSVKSSKGKAGETAGVILDLLKNESKSTIPELADRLEISTRAIEKHIQALKHSGELHRVGGRKNGFWKVIG